MPIRWLGFWASNKTASTKEVLEDIRSELHKTAEKHEDGGWYLRDKWVDEIIDKHMAKMQ